MSEADTLTSADLEAARAHARQVVEESATSFLWGMRILPEERRRGMFAIYAFCREVDDIADEPGAPEGKLARLEEWRAEIERLYEGRPTRPTTRALAGPVAAFKQAVVVQRLPKTRSGKILRGTMRRIADGADYDVPATIDDPKILDETRIALEAIGLGQR